MTIPVLLIGGPLAHRIIEIPKVTDIVEAENSVTGQVAVYYQLQLKDLPGLAYYYSELSASALFVELVTFYASHGENNAVSIDSISLEARKDSDGKEAGKADQGPASGPAGDSGASGTAEEKDQPVRVGTLH